MYKDSAIKLLAGSFWFIWVNTLDPIETRYFLVIKVDVTFNIQLLNIYSDEYKPRKLADNQRKLFCLCKEELPNSRRPPLIIGESWRWSLYKREYLTADYRQEDSSSIGQFLHTESLRILEQCFVSFC